MKALGVSLRGLRQWVRKGKIVPSDVIPGGPPGWEVDWVRHELRKDSARRQDPE